MVDQVIEDYYASTTQHYAGGILSKTNSSGSLHSADNLSPDVLWCENCPEEGEAFPNKRKRNGDSSTTQHSAGKQVMTMRNSEAKSSGSSHSADDLSPDVIWCRKWPEDAKRIVPANSESKNWNLCRQCWRDKGSPFFNACCYKCSEEGCPNVSYKTRGAA